MLQVVLCLAGVLLLNGCGRESGGAQVPAPNLVAATNVQTFQVKGIIKSVGADGKTLEVRHEEITNYMPAMTMEFDAKVPAELRGLKAGDAVTFRLNVTDQTSWIDQVRKLSGGNPMELPSRSTIRLVRNVEPLETGDLLPEYHFTNELGQAVSTTNFQGQALAITFIFTRCPLPNFCPRMSSNFEEVQKLLLSQPATPRNWHLLTISFDPQFDTPEILKAYAERFGADPKHWDFLTGDLVEVTALSEQFGQTFWREERALNHNLRTAVINTRGKVQRIIQGNTWKPEEVVEELKKAMGG